MGWADDHIEKLKAGQRVSLSPRGRSMEPLIMSGQQVTVEPVHFGNGVEVGDIVLCRVGGRQYLHLVKRYDKKQHRFEIGNNKGRINGWVEAHHIYGKRVEP